MSDFLFEDLLDDVERIRGGAWVDVEERVALQKLLARYDGTSLAEMRAAVAALLARSEREALEISQAFDELYVGERRRRADADDAKASVRFSRVSHPRLSATPEVRRLPSRRPTRSRTWSRWLAVVLGVAALWLGLRWRTGTGSGDDESIRPESGGGTRRVVEQRRPVPVAVEFSTPRPRVYWPPPSWAIGAAAGTALIALAFLSFREGARRRFSWNEKRWRAFSRLAGPKSLRVADEGRRPPSFAIEQLAALLELVAGRLFEGSRLDVGETVRQTAERVIVSVVRERHAATGRLLVLRDIGAPMLPWRTRIDRLIDDLQSNTAVDVLYFDDDVTQVSPSPGKLPLPLHAWVNHCGGLPLLVLTDGRFLTSAPGTRIALNEALSPWPVRVALHPLDDRGLWPAELTSEDSILPGFSMNRASYEALLRWLPSRAKSARDRFQPEPRPLWSDDVQRLLAMLSFLPEPSFEVAELLRTELMPHAPPSLLLLLEPVLSPQPRSAREVSEARAVLREWFRRNPDDAAAWEEFWNRHVPEPPVGSPAYQRYMRNLAVMRLHLDADSSDDAELEEIIRTFAHSPVADDWQRELEAVLREHGASADVKKRAKDLLEATRSAAVEGGALPEPRKWVVPRAATTAAACACALVLVPFGSFVAPREGPPVASASVTPPPETPPCGPGTIRCGGKCADPKIDPENCGTCGLACSNGDVCSSGVCGCATPLWRCRGTCVDVRSDAANCGDCGRACGRGDQCIEGQCRLCAGGELTECGGRCVNLKTDAANCGKCGATCGAPNADRRCVAGKCTRLACKGDFSDCNGNARDGCETALLSDPANCGKCGVICRTDSSGTAFCEEGYCNATACGKGKADCDGLVTNGCEASLDAATSCGQCGLQCAADEECVTGACKLRWVPVSGLDSGSTTIGEDCERTCERTTMQCKVDCTYGKVQMTEAECDRRCASQKNTCVSRCSRSPAP